MSEINDTLIKIRSNSFQQKVMNFLQEKDPIIEQEEIKIDQIE